MGHRAVLGPALWVERISEWCAAPDSWVATHAELGVCGALVLGEASSYVPAATEPELYVRSLIGSRDPRAKGAGRRLLALADERAAASGVTLLRVDCYAGGTGDLIAFYESCGYTRAETFAVEKQPQDWPGQVLARRLD
ncbi:GNAT family N-acetyltransferase [Microterricola gilva]|uniref:GNAT family N-acetyltransferase n=1 Tax=Microterricola gilva TaxID=393267 RepID=UPI001A916F83|nr:GNAT family N-acetyltransferase [Microterricola gilva]